MTCVRAAPCLHSEETLLGLQMPPARLLNAPRPEGEALGKQTGRPELSHRTACLFAFLFQYGETGRNPGLAAFVLHQIPDNAAVVDGLFAQPRKPFALLRAADDGTG